MAIISSHTLNDLNGSHDGGIFVSLKNLHNNENIFETLIDVGGRLNEFVPDEKINENVKKEVYVLIKKIDEICEENIMRLGLIPIGHIVFI